MALTMVEFVCMLALFGTAARGEVFMKRSDMSSVLKRQSACDPGETLCGTVGLTSYCARVGQKCCSLLYTAPKEATCCNLGTYALPGNYCCAGGGSCPNGKKCLACSPDDGNPATSAIAPPAPTSTSFKTTSLPPLPATSTRVLYSYYTFTFTYYYYQFYYIYVPTLTRSTPTSSEVTTTTIVSVYASNTAAAQSSFEAVTAILSLPTPESATELPTLPSKTGSAETTDEPSFTNAPANTTSSVEFTGGAGSQGLAAPSLHGAWGVYTAIIFGLVTGAMCIIL